MYNGYGYYEYTGRRKIDADKINRFLNDTLRLDQLLKESVGKGIVEVGFVAACAENDWQPEAKSV
ncbi:MAG: hypothetical protein QXY84_01880 [Candidatus Caldarchaeum sp.]